MLDSDDRCDNTGGPAKASRGSVVAARVAAFDRVASITRVELETFDEKAARSCITRA